jgi:sacsin
VSARAGRQRALACDLVLMRAETTDLLLSCAEILTLALLPPARSIGFNSVYHLTDLPSFVSGRHIAFFDPHCEFLPNITAANPGKRIDFVAHAVAAAHADQFAPYACFGCDMAALFEGTLFRFPLRTPEQAARSRLSKQAYTVDALRAVLAAFQKEAVHCLLFLRSVERIELLEWQPGAAAPALCFSATVEDAAAARAERAAYKRMTAAGVLAHSCYRVRFVTTTVEPGGASSSTIETYVISQAHGGGRSASLASTAAAQYGMRLVPWAAVAARVPSADAAASTPEEGVAFCTLPLPVRTGLPVHINAYFELSSNRRDIWFGDDLSGAGKVRSDWNECLLTDVAGPAYARLLAEVAATPGQSEAAAYALWPTVAPREPWGGCVRATYGALPPLRVLRTAARGGAWVTPRDAVLPDAAVEASPALAGALVAELVPLVTPPAPLRRLLCEHAAPGAPGTASPAMLCDALRRPGAHPGVAQRDVALACLHYILSDVTVKDAAVAATALSGIELVPLANGSMGSFAAEAAPPGSNAVFYVVTELEAQLLCAAPQVWVDRTIGDALLQRLGALAAAGGLNLRAVSTEALASSLLRHILPARWMGAGEVAFTPGADGHPSMEMLSLLWRRLALCESLEPFAAWPLMATRDAMLLPPLRGAPLLAHGTPTTMPPAAADALLRAGVRVLHADAGVQHTDLRAYAHECSALGVLDALRASAAGGGLPALAMRLQGASAEERRALSHFLLSEKILLTSPQPDAARAGRIAVLRTLPIFETYVLGESATPPAFTALPTDGPARYLPPAGVDAALLSSDYMVVSSDANVAAVLTSLGVARRSRAQFFRDDLLRRWERVPRGARTQAALTLLRELPALCGEERSFADAIAACAFVATASGQDRAPRDLYDPRVPELAALLDATTCFPAPPFDAPELAAPLAALGMRRAVTPDAVLEAARCVEAQAARGEAAAAQERGAALFRYLEADFVRLLDPHGGKPLVGVLKSLGGLLSADARAARADETAARDVFVAALRQIAWCPVLTAPPEPWMPWPEAPPAVAPPVATRPRADAWLVSAAAPLLACDCRSAPLAELLGWSTPPAMELLAAQLSALGVKHATVAHTALAQALAAAVPRLYTQLSDARSTPGFAAAAATLAGTRCVWVGAGFALTREVAFTGPLNLAPYLHVLPADLVCFRGLLSALGVRAAFGTDDYSSVLTRLAADAGDAPLTPSQLELAVWLLQQLLAEAWRPKADAAPLFVPGADGVLRPASALPHNDAPWLGAPEGDVILAHPLLSQAVAEAAGVGSMRRLLLAESAASIDLGLAGAELFGQSEALTTRLRHIIEAYADGPGVLCELVQNADDAGATHVSFCLDETTYGDNSVLGGRMAAWQGPALLCFNDSVFAPADLAAIARIGQESKVDRPATAGRFGLGFNSVYHFTDCPSFVTGEHLVFFDPHADNVPGTSPAHPGLKIKYAGGRLLQQFPDQFAPYAQYGCDMATKFNGTLFRFPLRTDVTAARSQIKGEAYAPAAVRSLFELFRENATRTMLFLKNIRRVSFMARGPGDAAPHLLYEVQLSTPGADPRQPAISFVAGSAGSCMNKAQFNALLARVPEAQLPAAAGVLHVRLVEGGGDDAAAASPPAERWLVCSAIGGGRARRMALEDVSGRGLVPWAGVAARLPPEDDTADASAAERGRAFCFLPLPVNTGLPVHVNAYFELSSNRRDIWFGDDMSGSGAKRSEWNVCLLEDVVAPAYARLLAEAARLLGPTPAFFALFPTGGKLREPWGCVQDRVQHRMHFTRAC